MKNSNDFIVYTFIKHPLEYIFSISFALAFLTYFFNFFEFIKSIHIIVAILAIAFFTFLIAIGYMIVFINVIKIITLFNEDWKKWYDKKLKIITSE